MQHTGSTHKQKLEKSGEYPWGEHHLSSGIKQKPVWPKNRGRTVHKETHTMCPIQRPGEFSFRDEHKALGPHKGRTQVQVTLDKDLGALDETLYEWQEEKASKEPELGCKNRRLESCVLLCYLTHSTTAGLLSPSLTLLRPSMQRFLPLLSSMH